MNGVMSSSDTSSSEENLNMLLEAVDGQFMNDVMFASKGTGDTHKGKYRRNGGLLFLM
jgi:hypothetical protein